MNIATHRFPKPSQCVLWMEPNRLDSNPSHIFDTVETYEEDSHLIRRLLKCRECGQLYFYEMYEVIDWADGEDPIYRTYIPVIDMTEAEFLKITGTPDLVAASPSLRRDFPKGAAAPKNYWVGK